MKVLTVLTVGLACCSFVVAVANVSFCDKVDVPPEKSVNTSRTVQTVSNHTETMSVSALKETPQEYANPDIDYEVFYDDERDEDS